MGATRGCCTQGAPQKQHHTRESTSFGLITKDIRQATQTPHRDSTEETPQSRPHTRSRPHIGARQKGLRRSNTRLGSPSYGLIIRDITQATPQSRLHMFTEEAGRTAIKFQRKKTDPLPNSCWCWVPILLLSKVGRRPAVSWTSQCYLYFEHFLRISMVRLNNDSL